MNTTEIIDTKEVGRRLRLARLASDALEQDEAAARIGVITRTLQNYEAGRVPWERLGGLADLYRVSKGWLLHGAGAPPGTKQAALERIEEREAITIDERLSRIERQLETIAG